MENKKLIIGGAIALGVAAIAGLGYFVYTHCICKSKDAPVSEWSTID